LRGRTLGSIAQSTSLLRAEALGVRLFEGRGDLANSGERLRMYGNWLWIS
jgi:hypothetical protein